VALNGRKALRLHGGKLQQMGQQLLALIDGDAPKRLNKIVRVFR
jgi:hypothetical protein